MHPIKSMAAIAAALILSACAHPLVISPDITKLEAPAKARPHKAVAGYYISDEQRAQEVTTPGGGGDKVAYFPYRDLDSGLFRILGNCFADVIRLKAPNDADALHQHRIAYIVTPQIKTDSSSPSAFTWPPTRFTVDLSASIADSDGKPVATKSVQGVGQAEFDEFKTDYALSGKRAMQDALQKLQQLLLDAGELGN